MMQAHGGSASKRMTIEKAAGTDGGRNAFPIGRILAIGIALFVAIFAGLGLAGTEGDYASAVALVAGVFCGSALWWLALSGAVGVLRDRFSPRAMLWVNRVSGVTILGFGLAALAGLL